MSEETPALTQEQLDQETRDCLTLELSEKPSRQKMSEVVAEEIDRFAEALLSVPDQSPQEPSRVRIIFEEALSVWLEIAATLRQQNATDLELQDAETRATFLVKQEIVSECLDQLREEWTASQARDVQTLPRTTEPKQR